MEFLFTDTEYDLARELVGTEPKGVWKDMLNVIFEFEDYYVVIETLEERAASPRELGEIMRARIHKYCETYIPNRYVERIGGMRRITAVKAVRTLIYFTEIIEDAEGVAKEDASWNADLALISGLSKRKVKKLFEGSPSIYFNSEICKPGSEKSKMGKPEYSNLIDVGLVVQFDLQYLPAFAHGNSYGLFHLDRKAFVLKEELEKQLGDYQVY